MLTANTSLNETSSGLAPRGGAQGWGTQTNMEISPQQGRVSWCDMVLTGQGCPEPDLMEWCTFGSMLHWEWIGRRRKKKHFPTIEILFRNEQEKWDHQSKANSPSCSSMMDFGRQRLMTWSLWYFVALLRTFSSSMAYVPILKAAYKGTEQLFVSIVNSA